MPELVSVRMAFAGGWAMSHLEDLFAFQIHAAKLPAPTREYQFSNTRRWRLDFAWLDRLLSAEIEGGTWVQGRHVRGSGMRADCEKYNFACLEGWTVLRFTGDMVQDGTALTTLEQAFR